MKTVIPQQLARGLVFNLPTIYAQQNGAVSKTGFGRYLGRLEKSLVHGVKGETLKRERMQLALHQSTSEMPARTLDGRRF